MEDMQRPDLYTNRQKREDEEDEDEEEEEEKQMRLYFLHLRGPSR